MLRTLRNGEHARGTICAPVIPWNIHFENESRQGKPKRVVGDRRESEARRKICLVGEGLATFPEVSRLRLGYGHYRLISAHS
jgi:hypothetical protein